MKNTKVTLEPLKDEDRENFIKENQWAFKHGALVGFGERDNHLDGDGEIISRKTIENCIDDPQNEALRIICDGKIVGGMVLKIDKNTRHNHLEILFVSPEEHGKGIGYSAWCEAERRYPETVVWETCTPYFEKRNIHFYINKCGFSIVEFFCEFNPEPNQLSEEERCDEEGPDEMFRFLKTMDVKN